MTGNNTFQGTGDEISGIGGVREFRESPCPGEEIVYLSILREVPDGLVLLDDRGTCRYLNEAFTRITGYTREDVPTLEAWFERAHPNPAYRQKVQGQGQELFRGDRNALVASVVRRDGKVRDLEIRRAPVEGGCSLLAVRDVTEHALVEEHLRQATSELTAVIEAFPDLFLRLNADGTILDSRAGRLSDVPLVSRALLGRRLQDLLPAGAGEALGNSLLEAVRTNAPAAPFEFICSDAGGVRHYEARVVPLYETHLMAVIREITERKRAEQELHRHREHLEELVAERTKELEHANQQLERLLYYIEMTERRAAEEWLDSSIEQGTLDAAGPEEARITTDAAGTIVIVNTAAEFLTGYAGEDLAGLSVWSLLSGGDAAEVLASEVLARGRSGECTVEAMVVRKDGSRRPVRVSADPILDDEGAVTGMICTLRQA
ncbi:PAS domain S-box protein [Methanoculleus sp. Wushi-C6]|uniref:PAS domain S-box protein n=1 Tax=Methanoculleus caldifontis TaxID=2651577 RepID=A0ABU3WZ83_9EURY|nr:PAS domain S-box protein [Methanoculleus sp. Wushi-C6]MDV2480471.1 PAS domain S-box protein [Methanoculleus sp. Wushi-C6]